MAFLEIVISARDLQRSGVASRDELEDALNEALEVNGVGEVTGGGAGDGVVIVDVEISDRVGTAAGLNAIRAALKGAGAPRSTVIRAGGPKGTTHTLYGNE